MFLAIISLMAGISISAVAIYYSVLGLASIFSGAHIPIIVMGSILEISKLVSAWWLKANWSRAPILLKSYMFVAVLVLMLITSMGIFGFLSKAHSDQGVPLGNVVAQISHIDDRIKIQEDNIVTAKASLAQLDSQVNERIAKSTNGSGVDKSTQIRKQQTSERSKLQKEITVAQDEILKLKDQKSPLASKLREVEAEVGPIKYIAKLIYGDNPDANLLEKAVVWVIITIVFVFDPLAVLLLLASQLSFQWARLDKSKSLPNVATAPIVPDSPVNTNLTDAETSDTYPVYTAPQTKPIPVITGGRKIRKKAPPAEPTSDTEVILADINPVVEQPVSTPIEPVIVPTTAEPTAKADEEADQAIINQSEDVAKLAMARWKAENPTSSLKQQRALLAQGIIDKLPWDEYLLPEADEENDAAVEAAKWANEQLEKKRR